MKWFVNNVFWYSPINAKAKELGQWVESYKHTLFPDETSQKDFIKDAQAAVHYLNEKYPRTKPFIVELTSIGDGTEIRMTFSVKGDIKTIAYMDIVKVLKEYSESRKGGLL